MEENKITQDKIENKKKTNKLLPIVIICGLILIGVFAICKLLFNYIKSNALLTPDKAEAILKERDELYKGINTPHPYCGKVSEDRITDEISQDSQSNQQYYIVYWSLSSEFQSYNQLLNFISDNMTDKLIQKLKSKKYKTFNNKLYIEKDNKLYCGHIGAVGDPPQKNTLYRINEYNDTTIIGTVTDIYGVYGANSNDYTKKYDIILVKENGLWKIDSYEVNENN